ncbi:hypothetical protein BJ875DRAFT_509806 [Amylocarpus encephaloides]|uniref:DNA/RNA-binding protein Alba-like domain-containing protein n=1 Tax=Amylocarpus encephaloides TaxID=45428 RepID=A0A9P7YIN5_9HELO|nr:hypothetical protein BJ875DRAFT_509806 [Amylocarpus encephaloides]
MGRSKSKPKNDPSGHISSANSPHNPDLAKRKRENGAEVDGTSPPLDGDDPLDTRPSKKRRGNRRKNHEDSRNTGERSHPKPSQPTSTPSDTTPPVFPSLEKTHDISVLSIISSSKISKRVTTTLSVLAQPPAIPPAKPSVVMLHARADSVSKLISVVEIAKREIGSRGGKWFQYNALHQAVKAKKEGVKGGDKGQGEENGEDMDEDEDEDEGEKSDGEVEEGFEKMKTPFERAIEGTVKVRTVPIMATYLSRVRVEGLRKRYGEQTSGLKVKDVPRKQ